LKIYLFFYRIFEVRGTHLDYKPPEVKVSNLNKITKATALRMKDNEKNDKKKINEIKEAQKLGKYFLNFFLFY